MYQTEEYQLSPYFHDYSPIDMSHFNSAVGIQPYTQMTQGMIGPIPESDRPYYEYLNNYIHYNNYHNHLFAYHLTVGNRETEADMSNVFPALEGPLVSQKISSHAITEEYARADPVYVQKTVALPQMYSHYRAILGDGNCGWRAVGFSYFETMLRYQSKARLEEEITRMSSLNNLLMTAGGFEYWLFEDMVSETIGLLRDLSERVETNLLEAEAVLMERFNNADISNSIIYHFRLLASSWLKANPAAYEGFILDGSGVEAYSKNYIEPVNIEIEHLIMCLLIDVLLKPIGITVEIVYLDRTPGPHANTHIFQQEDASGAPKYPGGPVIHLLFRPSHYDILYRDQSISMCLPPTPSNQAILQANRALTEQHLMQSTPAAELEGILIGTPLLSSLPNHTKSPPDSQDANLSIFINPHEQSCVSSDSPCTSPALSISSSTFSSHLTQATRMESPSFHSHMPTSPLFPLHSDFSPQTRKSLFPLISGLPSRSSTSSFRPSKYELAAACDWQEGHGALQSPTFKNSHYNTAHFNNANFQPEQWVPERDETSHSRKKSSG
ncbi:hypothetical protein GcC1_188026 [Golovinomyces cichoracearum]|uniref:ubiquitinyl hydrolase 1 n=1 Tax=Golovinomyces cichoracearum TaxID=62708 RepID=A0A420HJN8_9PEZI|nr:hypothetical protein GcC1_188026 [Golovinomyces cichoracearum]